MAVKFPPRLSAEPVPTYALVSVFNTAMLIAPPIPTPLPPAASPPAVVVTVEELNEVAASERLFAPLMIAVSAICAMAVVLAMFNATEAPMPRLPPSFTDAALARVRLCVPIPAPVRVMLVGVAAVARAAVVASFTLSVPLRIT